MTGSYRLAWQDLWSGRRHFAVAISALALGVGAMTASRTLGSQFSRRLNSDVRQWIAADAAVTLPQPPSEEENTAVLRLSREGIEASESIESFTMAASDHAADPVLVSVRGVDPRTYPWYGEVLLEPRQPLRGALGPDTAVISQNLAERLAVQPGNRILLNGVDFRIAAILAAEPDRLASTPNPYPRVMLSDDGFARSRTVARGNATWRLLFRAPAGTSALKARLQSIFPEGTVIDHRGNADPLAAALDAALTYLDLTAWTALALGSLGVGLVMFLHIEQRLDTVAILKVLGGRWKQIVHIYLLEAGAISLVGCAIGVALSIPANRLFLLMVKDQLPFAVPPDWQWLQAAEAVGIGMLSSLLATAVPLLGVRSIAPLPILRRYVSPLRSGPRGVILSLSGMAALAFWMVHSWKAGAAFLLGLAAGGMTLAAIGWLPRRASWNRPGRRGEIRFLAMGAGVMLVTTSWVGPGAVIRAIRESLPLPGADLFVLDLGPEQTGALTALLNHDPDVIQPVELLPSVVLRLANAPERWIATCLDANPAGPLSAGHWWQRRTVTPEAVMAESLAAAMGAKLGQTLEFVSNGTILRARIVGLRRLDAIEERRGGLVFPCSAFAGLRVVYEAGIAVKPARIDAVRRTIVERYPSIPLISRRELEATFEDVARDAIWILRVAGLLILAAGTATLVLIVLAEEKTRSREIAILRAIGARPTQVRTRLLEEFTSFGAYAGAAGGALGTLFSTLLLSVIFRKLSWTADAKVLAGALLLGVLTSVAAGWVATVRISRQKPFAILRDE